MLCKTGALKIFAKDAGVSKFLLNFIKKETATQVFCEFFEIFNHSNSESHLGKVALEALIFTGL